MVVWQPTNRETADMKKTNPLYVLSWYVPPILLIPALFMFLVRVDASERILDLLCLLLVLLIVAIPLCVPILMKKRMEKRAAVLEKDFPNINTNLHPTTVYSIWIPRAAMSVWVEEQSLLSAIRRIRAQITDIRTNNGQQFGGAPPW